MEQRIIREEVMEDQEIYYISPNELLNETLSLKNKGYRLVAISCCSVKSNEVTYSFNKDNELIHLRLDIGPDVEINSISSIYPYSFIYENEIKELFGVKINGISLDYNDNFYKIPVKTPFAINKEEK